MDEAGDPAPRTPSAAGQEPPFVGALVPDPPTAVEPGAEDGSGAEGGEPTGDATANAPSSGPQRIRLRIPPSGGTIRINSQGGGIRINATRPGSEAPGGPGRVHGRGHVTRSDGTHPTAGGRPMPRMGHGGPGLPPLEPQPLPNQASDATADGASAADAERHDVATNMKKFECAICYEYMESPVGCGSCQARFCGTCLRRVLRQGMADRPPDSDDPPASAKCPSCRAVFTPQSVVHDKELCKQIRGCTETVACPFKGCGAEMRIGLLKAHEAECPYIRMRCRFAEWGCAWVGRKKDLDDHEAHQCEFRGGLGKLVERFRQSEVQSNHLLQQHHMQLGATSQMLSLHSRQMMMLRGKHSGSVLDVLHLVYVTCLFPGQFSATREVWSSVINSQEARCAVCNMLLMMPSLALVFNISAQGFKLLSSIDHLVSSEDALWSAIDSLLLSLIMSLLGILGIMCFYIDSKSPIDWTIYNVRRIIPGQPILRDLAAISVAMMHFIAIEFYRPLPALILWHFTAIVTVFLTSFVCCIIEKNETPSSNSIRILKTARAWPVVVFGLRIGLVAAWCGLAPSITAVAVLRILGTCLPSSAPLLFKRLKATMEDSDCFLSQLGLPSLIGIAGLFSVIDYAGLNGISWLGVLVDHLAAIGILTYAIAFVLLLDSVGIILGEKNFHTGTAMFMQANRAAGAVLPNTKPAPIGCVALGACSFLTLCIASW